MQKRLLYLWILLTICITSTQAEVVVLRSGQQIKGEMLLNNDEVVILRQKNGLRYQYPKTEVVAIKEDTEEVTTEENTNITPQKSVAIRATAAGGAAYIPHVGWGGTMEAHLMVGTQRLFGQPFFLGGSIGYRGVFNGDNTYSWIPLQLALQYPIAYQPTMRHRPLLGASFGYSFATNKQWGGGLCAGVDFGWWYQINTNSNLSIALTAQWQQTQINIKETINNIEYTNHIGCNILGIGIKVGIQF